MTREEKERIQQKLHRAADDIIRDRVYLRLWFCKARNPKEAWQKYDNECRSLAIAWGEEG